MNGKKAKALRSLAAECAGSQPSVMYQRKKRNGPITNHPQTTRAVYQELKARFQEGKKQ